MLAHTNKNPNSNCAGKFSNLAKRDWTTNLTGGMEAIKSKVRGRRRGDVRRLTGDQELKDREMPIDILRRLLIAEHRRSNAEQAYC